MATMERKESFPPSLEKDTLSVYRLLLIIVLGIRYARK